MREPRPRVLVTLAGGTGRDLVRELEAQGAMAERAPALKLNDTDPAALDAALCNPSPWTDLLLTSRRAVSILARRLRELCRDGRALAPWRITVIGRGTAGALEEELGLRPDAVADESSAEGLRTALGDVSGRRFLQPRARAAREVLEKELGGALTVIPVYETQAVDWTKPAVRVAAGQYDAVIFGSASATRVVMAAVRSVGDWPSSTRCIALGSVTAAALRDLGMAPVTASSPDPIALAAAALEGSSPP